LVADSVFDDGAGRAPGFGPLPGGAEWADVTGAVGDRVEGGCGLDDGLLDTGVLDAGLFGDVEVVDEFGLPVLPPDHTEAELAAILATCPLDDPEVADAAAEYLSRGPDGSTGVVVDPSRRRLEQVGRRNPDLALAGVLQNLTGLEVLFGAGLDDGDTDGTDTTGTGVDSSVNTNAVRLGAVGRCQAPCSCWS
jgi:hypothetical protein